jgi:transposase
MIRKIGLGILSIMLVIQFIRPPRNTAEGISENDISKMYGMPQAVHTVFVQKCYDCHSHNTVYPWYVNVQPVGWWMYRHIQEGRRHLDFSEFKTYSDKKAAHKLEEIIEMIREKEMPLKSYRIAHPEAAVTPNEELAINNWIQSLGIEQSR